MIAASLLAPTLSPAVRATNDAASLGMGLGEPCHAAPAEGW
jgi:hypothetical protein